MPAGGGILPRVPRLHIPAIGREPRNPSMRPIKPQSQPPHPYTAPQQGEFSKSPSADTRGKREGGRRRSRKRGAPPGAGATGDPGAAGSLRPAASAGFFPIPPAAIEAGVGRREEKWRSGRRQSLSLGKESELLLLEEAAPSRGPRHRPGASAGVVVVDVPPLHLLP